jgi:flagellar motor switch/type III secretory pathway protein FliN
LRDALIGLGGQLCIDLPGLSKFELVKAANVSLDKLGRHGFSLSWRTSGSMAVVGRVWGTLDPDLAARMRLAFVEPIADQSGSIPALATGSLLASIVDRPLSIGALLGRAQISAIDLERLQPGDVLVLDRPIASALELTVNDRPVTDWACEPVAEDGQPLKLHLKNPRTGASL